MGLQRRILQLRVLLLLGLYFSGWIRTDYRGCCCVVDALQVQGHVPTHHYKYHHTRLRPDTSLAATPPRPTTRTGRHRRPLRQPIRRSPQRQTESNERQQQAQAAYEEALLDPDLLTHHTFSGTATDDSDNTNHPTTLLPPGIIRALTEDMGLRQLTTIQAQTLEAVGHFLASQQQQESTSSTRSTTTTDQQRFGFVGQARTGTGKTLAYLLAATLLQLPLPPSQKQQRHHRGTTTLILAPTRELVVQIRTIAVQLYQHVQQQQGSNSRSRGSSGSSSSSSSTIQALHGGTNIARDRAVLRQLVQQYQQQQSIVVVATPGRLLELATSSRFIADLLRTTDTLVVDEADRVVPERDTQVLLQRYLSQQRCRHTLLLSATISPQFLRKYGTKLLPTKYYDTTAAEAAATAQTPPRSRNSSDTTHQQQRNNTPTNVAARVEQYHYHMTSIDQYLDTFWSLLDQERHSKVILFLPTTKLVKFLYTAVSMVDTSTNNNNKCWSIHSRMGQGARTRAHAQFSSSATGAVLLTSDVSARGVDYPNVDLVVQVCSCWLCCVVCLFVPPTLTRRSLFFFCVVWSSL